MEQEHSVPSSSCISEDQSEPGPSAPPEILNLDVEKNATYSTIGPLQQRRAQKWLRLSLEHEPIEKVFKVLAEEVQIGGEKLTKGKQKDLEFIEY